MDKRMINISREVSAGKLLDENIPQLFGYMADRYYTFAGIRLAMHYDVLAESYLEEKNAWSADGASVLSQINVLIRNTIADRSGPDPEKYVHTADRLRDGIMGRMKVLTAYTDIFQNYEYVLNRIEYRFKKEKPVPEDNDFARRTLRYIFDSNDNLIINEKIKEIIGQLPIRMTKQKYFDLLAQSVRLYTGADKKTLQSYLYVIQTSAMLLRENGMDTMYPELEANQAWLSGLKYRELSAKEYETAKNTLNQAVALINREISIYYGLQEIINELYAFLLCKPYAGMSPGSSRETEEIVFSILGLLTETITSQKEMKGKINKGTDTESCETRSKKKEKVKKESLKDDGITKVAERFAGIEGVQEELADELAVLEDTLFTVNQDHGKIVEGIMLDKLMNVLLRTRDLLSSSLFIDWNKASIGGKADKEYAEEEAGKLCKKLNSSFDRQDRAVTRAVMANTLNKMPVFFHDHKEVMDYVRSSLENCSDLYEKAACVEIINNMIAG